MKADTTFLITYKVTDDVTGQYDTHVKQTIGWEVFAHASLIAHRVGHTLISIQYQNDSGRMINADCHDVIKAMNLTF